MIEHRDSNCACYDCIMPTRYEREAWEKAFYQQQATPSYVTHTDMPPLGRQIWLPKLELDWHVGVAGWVAFIASFPNFDGGIAPFLTSLALFTWWFLLRRGKTDG